MVKVRIYFVFAISMLCLNKVHAWQTKVLNMSAVMVFHAISSDTIVKDIPVDKKGRSVLFDRLTVARDSIGGLDLLENGFDSLQIRIWYSYASKDTSQILVIRNAHQQWNAELITNAWIVNNEGKSAGLKKNIRSLFPQNGWQHLMNKLWSLKFHVLPDYSRIAGYPQTMDGDQIIVEIATSKSYRMFSYKDPFLMKERVKEAGMIEEILKLLESEFQFQQLRPI